ncbi:FMP43 Found in Mitochondrial Proteome [Fusarium albosuccineum]|uniref:Mitochondrial pyruvate carrier n=1 Tax=Fusarium albosuccineum TaxID=1237068 RepID=A0A8H4LAX5_9HYPO|nr:FMP43 Found in Mitochondrial Proteome [Fusarium albosuccineum]
MASPANALFRASRPLFRQATLGAPARQAFRAQARQNFYQGSGRRWQSTDGAHQQQQQQQSWFNRMWESEVGFKTVHFWAPVMKAIPANQSITSKLRYVQLLTRLTLQWALVLAGISDFARPAEKLSFTQNLALTCTGIIWTRCLAAVNFFLGMVGLVQITRIAKYESAKKAGLQGAIEDIKADAKQTIKEVKA